MAHCRRVCSAAGELVAFVRLIVILSCTFTIVIDAAAAPLTSSRDRCSCGRSEIILSEEHTTTSLFSPDYPRPYCGGLDCVYVVRALTLNSTAHVRFVVPRLDLRPHRDVLFFYDGGGNAAASDGDNVRQREPSHNCTGRQRDCEFTSAGRLIVRLRTGRGVPDRYGFKATVTLLHDDNDNERQPLRNTAATVDSVDDNDDDESDAPIAKTTTTRFAATWEFLLWMLIVFGAIVLIIAVVCVLCRRRRRHEENRSPLLGKTITERDENVNVVHESTPPLSMPPPPLSMPPPPHSSSFIEVERVNGAK